MLLCMFAFKWNYLKIQQLYEQIRSQSPQRTWNDTIRRIRLVCKSFLYISITICILFLTFLLFLIPASPYFIKRPLFKRFRDRLHPGVRSVTVCCLVQGKHQHVFSDKSSPFFHDSSSVVQEKVSDKQEFFS